MFADSVSVKAKIVLKKQIRSIYLIECACDNVPLLGRKKHIVVVGDYIVIGCDSTAGLQSSPLVDTCTYKGPCAIQVCASMDVDERVMRSHVIPLVISSMRQGTEESTTFGVDEVDASASKNLLDD